MRLFVSKKVFQQGGVKMADKQISEDMLAYHQAAEARGEGFPIH